MSNKFQIVFLFLFFCFKSQAQVDSTFVKEETIEAVDTTAFIIPENVLENSDANNLFFEKLKNLEKSKSGKVNIVHIGDSHIQADILTGKVRKNLQEVFGNGGRGFVFPLKLAKTNGAFDVKFASNVNWESYRIVSPLTDKKLGLSGIYLNSNSDDFSIELSVKEPQNYFNIIKIITPDNENSFFVATDKKVTQEEITVPKTVFHKVVKGDAISSIAKKYGVSVAKIKSLNKLKSNKIKSGTVLRISDDGKQNKFVEHTEFIPIETLNGGNFHYYYSNKALDKIDLIPNSTQDSIQCNLNGIVLENDLPGIEYHNIGVNGAKFSDYNKYPLFFEQLQSLSPDLIIASFGTNESFDKLNPDEFMNQLNLFLKNIRAQIPNVAIIITTPQPSLFQRKYANNFVEMYAQKIEEYSKIYNYSIIDIFSQLGGLKGAFKNKSQGLMAADGVHFSVKGYEMQANLISDALLKAYQNYNNK